MSVIEIKRPIEIYLEVMETDSHLPSFKTKTRISIGHPTGHIIYDASDIWFECSKWDIFLTNVIKISAGNKGEALLQNMSEFFILKISSMNKEKKFEFRSQEVNAGEGTAAVHFISTIDDDIVAHVKEQFAAFDKWW